MANRLHAVAVALLALVAVAHAGIYKRAIAPLTGVNPIGGSISVDSLAGGQITLTAYRQKDGSTTTLETSARVTDIKSGGNPPTLTVCEGNRLTKCSAGTNCFRAPLTWINLTREGIVTGLVTSITRRYSFKHVSTVTTTNGLFDLTTPAKVLETPRAYFAFISYDGADCALRGNFVRANNPLN